MQHLDGPGITVDAIRRKPILLERFLGGRSTAFSLLSKIWLPASMYREVATGFANPRVIALLLHEQAHLRSQARTGLLKWHLRYMRRGYRLSEEIDAYTVQLDYLDSLNLSYDIERIAKALSSWQYLWPAPYAVVLHRLMAQLDKRKAERIIDTV